MPQPKAKKQNVQTKSSNVRYRKLLSDQAERLVRTMENIVAPGEGEPVVFPGYAPSRCGVARYRLGTTIVADEENTSFGIEVTPNLVSPLKITRTKPAIIASSDDIFSITGETGGFGTVHLEALVSTGGENIHLASESKYGTLVVPIAFTAASPIISVRIRGTNVHSAGKHDFSVSMWNDGVQQDLVTTALSAAVQAANVNGIAPTPASLERFVSISYDTAFPATWAVEITASTGLLTVLPAENVLTSLAPNWLDLVNESDRFRICAADALFTYHGADIDNAGSIALANVDSSIPLVQNPAGDCSFYDTIVQRPFDMYSGKLASSGETEGGGHWVYFPDSAEQLRLETPTSSLNHDIPKGLVGITGMKPGGVVRIQMNFVVNFYSELPKYSMLLQPPSDLFDLALLITRKNIDIVSSNDSHVNKLKKIGKSSQTQMSKIARSALQWIIDNPEIAASQAMGLLI